MKTKKQTIAKTGFVQPVEAPASYPGLLGKVSKLKYNSFKPGFPLELPRTTPQSYDPAKQPQTITDFLGLAADLSHDTKLAFTVSVNITPDGRVTLAETPIAPTPSPVRR